MANSSVGHGIGTGCGLVIGVILAIIAIVVGCNVLIIGGAAAVSAGTSTTQDTPTPEGSEAWQSK